MIRGGSPTYGPSKAALEAFSAVMAKDLAGTGVTVNVLVPGGMTNTGMIPPEAGYDRGEMIQPEVMAPPLNWLVSDAAAAVTGRRFPGYSLGPRPAARGSRRQGRRAGRLDRYRHHADRTGAAKLTAIYRPPRRAATEATTGRPMMRSTLSTVISVSRKTSR